jgi:hypothetical protein
LINSCKSKCSNSSPHCSQGATSIGTRATCVTVHASAPGSNAKGWSFHPVISVSVAQLNCPILPQIFSFSIFQHFVDLFVDLTFISPWILKMYVSARNPRHLRPPMKAPARVYSASGKRVHKTNAYAWAIYGWSQNLRHERTGLGVRPFLPLNLSSKSFEPHPHS